MGSRAAADLYHMFAPDADMQGASVKMVTKMQKFSHNAPQIVTTDADMQGASVKMVTKMQKPFPDTRF